MMDDMMMTVNRWMTIERLWSVMQRCNVLCVYCKMIQL